MRFFASIINALPSLPFQIMVTLAVCTSDSFDSTKKETAEVLELSLRIEKNAHGSVLQETKEKEKGYFYAS
ncbi:hypothetical protein Krac_3126 [Ktedonobacter racemifer DSM 44963]|uniref:Uncharacterized protein n=1 Tax=Ktedonobacter racemifer DSM 44963 TaxID=485913 RepID=D6U0I3_KTERA|nr:hypothetical protein Krac_3126 [Ktedonobacter racemifer DSM 44963]